MQDKLKREIVKTADGSTTIHIPDWNEQYHSKHGAINEANHVFIEMGLRHFLKFNTTPNLKILEIGFGTGLNAFITFLESERQSQVVDYFGVEAYPVSYDVAKQMNYAEALLVKEKESIFEEMHQSPWEKPKTLSRHFILVKRQQFFEDIKDENAFNLIYFDAFGARVQPELWTVSVFKKMFDSLQTNGVLVTYAAKGSVRRAMQEVGFEVERLPGPPGKREMLRATKISA